MDHSHPRGLSDITKGLLRALYSLAHILFVSSVASRSECTDPNIDNIDSNVGTDRYYCNKINTFWILYLYILITTYKLQQSGP